MLAKFIPLIIAAYLFGSIPTAYLAARWYKGVDIRQRGTGNMGASNVMSSTSKLLAIPVALFDIGKGILPILAARLLGLGVPEQMAVGIAAVIGHNWSLYVKFQGGRGIFTSLGVIIITVPWLGLISALIGYSLFPIKQVALSVFIGLSALPFFSWFLWQPLGIREPERLAITLGFAALAILAFARRLLVRRTTLSRSIPGGELFINRLLFDRDIRDRRLWIKRKSADEQAAGK